MTRCARCGRPLSDLVSVQRGYGPVCWKKIQQQEKSKKICKRCGNRFYSLDQSEYCPICKSTMKGREVLDDSLSEDILEILRDDDRIREFMEKFNEGRATAKEVARIIRVGLRIFFPDSRISVRSGSGGGRGYIDVEYTDGPSLHAVEKFCKIFNEKENMYVSVQRHLSEPVLETLKGLAEQMLDYSYRGEQTDIVTAAYRISRRTSVVGKMLEYCSEIDRRTETFKIEERQAV